MRVIYRQIDLEKDKNAPLYFPEDPVDGQENMFRIIMRLMAENQIPAYEYLDGREIFTDQYKVKMRDVLDRFIGAARSVGANKVIRVCADNVFLDMKSLRFLYETFHADRRHDYMSFRKSDGTPSIKTHYGFWAEAVTLDALEKVARATDDPLYHEHVTNYIYSHPDMFGCCLHQIDPEVESHEDLRLTMDTPEDYSLQRELYAALGGDERQIEPEALIKYLDMHRELYTTMRRNIESNSK